MDVDSRRDGHWLAPPPPDSHRQVLAMHQKQPGIHNAQCTSGEHKQMIKNFIIFFLIRLVVMTLPAVSASLVAT